MQMEKFLNAIVIFPFTFIMSFPFAQVENPPSTQLRLNRSNFRVINDTSLKPIILQSMNLANWKL